MTRYKSEIISGLGAAGVALQNYQAVEIFAKGFLNGTALTSQITRRLIQATAFGAGGVCSGMVNYWMNVGLLDKFFNRMNADTPWQYQQLSAWQQIQYFGGISIFLVTGILFGMMAFTFTMSGPMVALSASAGVFVAGIMTIQEVETWLDGWTQENQATNTELTASQQYGKMFGHIIAIGNVFALSLLFTLSMAEALMAISIAPFPALIAGASVAFTFGAFTEYYFYNHYLSEYCKNLNKNWQTMMESPNAMFGLLCVSTNAFVNTALTWSGVEMLSGLLVAASITLPPTMVITTMAAVSAAFAGSASFILGLDFWSSSNHGEVEYNHGGLQPTA